MDRVYVMELVRAFQCGGITRRQFLDRTTKAIGSVAAANVLLAACVPLPEESPPPVVVSPTGAVPRGDVGSGATTATPQGDLGDIVTESVKYEDAAGETLMGYLARPGDEEPAPAVVVIQEWWGLNDHIRDVARRFASAGFVALAPDLYHGVTVSEPDEARKLVMELDMREAVREIRQAIDFLQSQSYVAGQQSAKVGIVGYCMGGGLVLQTARVEEDLGAAVAYYGSPLTPSAAQEVQAPVLGLYGAEDTGISVEAVRKMEAALDEAGITNEFHIYEGAGHAFFNDTRSSYDSEAAADAWPRTLEWFRTYLNG